MFTILVVEDDPSTQKLMRAVLTRAGYEVLQAMDANEALEIVDHNHIDLAILDVMMPGMDGYELCKEFREAWPSLPMLMVTAMQEIHDKHRGFMAGTDDYMTKPVDNQEMLLRIQALLRRAKAANERRLIVGTTELDFDNCIVIHDGQRLLLPQKEFHLLYKLLSSPGTVLTRLQLMDEIWGMDNDSDDHTVNVHINRLRNRFKDNNDFSLTTVRGLGYMAEKTI